MKNRHKCFGFPLALVLAAACSEAGHEMPTGEGTVSISQTGIRNGYTFSFPETIAARTVKLRNPESIVDGNCCITSVCTGVVVSPHAIVTARHCVTVDEQIMGQLVSSPSVISVDNYPLAYSPTPVDWAIHDDIDIAVLFFEDPLDSLINWDDSKYPAPFAEVLPTYLSMNGVSGSTFFTMPYVANGYGKGSCDDSDDSYIERWGLVRIYDNTGVSGRYQVVPYDDANQLPMKGDSGSGLWHAMYNDMALLGGILSTGSCTEANYISTVSFEEWLRAETYSFLASINKINNYWTGNQMMLGVNKWAATSGGSCSTMLWYASGDEVREDSNCHSSKRGALLVRDDTAMTNGYAFVQIRAADDDEQGLAFRIRDKNNYYYAVVNATSGKKSLFRFENGVRRTIWSGAASIDLSQWKWIGARADRDRLYIYYDGVWNGPFYDEQDPIHAGGFGLYERAQQYARFRYMRLFQMP